MDMELNGQPCKISRLSEGSNLSTEKITMKSVITREDITKAIDMLKCAFESGYLWLSKDAGDFTERLAFCIAQIATEQFVTDLSKNIIQVLHARFDVCVEEQGKVTHGSETI